MNNDELKSRVGANIARLRRERGMTQAELAERINYSDKAVSKWERAESLPDVLTLISLAEQLDTDLNTLVGMSANPKTEPVSEPESPIPEKPAKKRRTADRGVIQQLSCYSYDGNTLFFLFKSILRFNSFNKSRYMEV